MPTLLCTWLTTIAIVVAVVGVGRGVAVGREVAVGRGVGVGVGIGVGVGVAVGVGVGLGVGDGVDVGMGVWVGAGVQVGSAVGGGAGLTQDAMRTMANSNMAAAAPAGFISARRYSGPTNATVGVAIHGIQIGSPCSARTLAAGSAWRQPFGGDSEIRVAD